MTLDALYDKIFQVTCGISFIVSQYFLITRPLNQITEKIATVERYMIALWHNPEKLKV